MEQIFQFKISNKFQWQLNCERNKRILNNKNNYKPWKSKDKMLLNSLISSLRNSLLGRLIKVPVDDRQKEIKEIYLNLIQESSEVDRDKVYTVKQIGMKPEQGFGILIGSTFVRLSENAQSYPNKEPLTLQRGDYIRLHYNSP